MNGISLLVALSAVGIISVDWERTPSGEQAYTIRIEPHVVDTLRSNATTEGQAIESVVAIRDRKTIRNFRVIVGPKNPQTDGRRAPLTSDEIQYGWVPNDVGGIDYFAQITPERLQSLAQGYPLECTVHPSVPQIDKIYVFVGTQTLPRELPQGLRAGSNTPREIDPASPPRNGGVATVSNNETTGTSARYGDNGYGSQGSPQVSVSDTATRPNGYGNTTGTTTASGYGPNAPASTGNYGPYNNTIAVPQLGDGRGTGYGGAGQNGYDTGNPYGPRQETARPSGSPYGNGGYAQAQQPAYPNSGTYVAGVPNQPTYVGQQQPMVPVSTQVDPAVQSLIATFQQQQADFKAHQEAQEKKLEAREKELEEARLASAAAAAATSEKAEEKGATKPFILTTLALFASIGANAYLGWLAWSFFWRFRDAASDLSRARSSSFPAGSAVGH